jgi:hypothetical protein
MTEFMGPNTSAFWGGVIGGVENLKHPSTRPRCSIFNMDPGEVLSLSWLTVRPTVRPTTRRTIRPAVLQYFWMDDSTLCSFGSSGCPAQTNGRKRGNQSSSTQTNGHKGHKQSRPTQTNGRKRRKQMHA